MLKLHKAPKSSDVYYQFQQMWNKLQSLNCAHNEKKFSKPHIVHVDTSDGDFILVLAPLSLTKWFTVLIEQLPE